MRSILLFLLISITLFSCHNQEHAQGHQHSHHDHHANAYMNKMSFEELVEKFESEEREKWQKPAEVIKLLGDINEKTILDIGAGTGYFTFRMAEQGATVIAADIDDRFQNYIKDKKRVIGEDKVKLRKTALDDPLVQPAEVHHAIIVNSYHHIEDRVAYFKKVGQGLKTEGCLMVVDFKKEKSPNGPPENHRIAADKVMEELSKAGFTDFEVNKELLEEHYIILSCTSAKSI